MIHRGKALLCSLVLIALLSSFNEGAQSVHSPNKTYQTGSPTPTLIGLQSITGGDYNIFLPLAQKPYD